MQQGLPWELRRDSTSHEISPRVMETEVSLPCPQVRATYHCPELDQPSPHPTTLFIEVFFSSRTYPKPSHSSPNLYIIILYSYVFVSLIC